MKPSCRLLWFALMGLGIGAAILHPRVHPPSEGLTYLWPSLFSFVDLVLVSLLFLSRRTAVWGLLLNSFLAFIGIIMMADFSLSLTFAGLVQVRPADGLLRWLLRTTFPDVTILFADLMVGQALYRAIMTRDYSRSPMGNEPSNP
jgi:hypothetical protein